MAKKSKPQDPLAARYWARIIEVEGYQVLLTAEYDGEDDKYKLGVATYSAFGEYKMRFSDFGKGTPEKDLAHIQRMIKSDKDSLKNAQGLIASMRKLIGDSENQVQMVHEDDLEGREVDPIRTLRICSDQGIIDGLVEQ